MPLVFPRPEGHGIFDSLSLRQASAAGQRLLDLVFPPRCPGCGRLGVLFCDSCQAQIEPIIPPVCRRCGHPTPEDGTGLSARSFRAESPGPCGLPAYGERGLLAHGERGVAGAGFRDVLCEACQATPSNLDGIKAVGIFAHPLREAIHALKYENCRGLAAPLGACMADAWSHAHPPADLLMPVPLHASRVAERGYNQSALLARILGSAARVPVVEGILVRQKATLPQVGLSWHERRRNVSDAFVCRESMEGQRVVLVDDVCTTGATLEACAAALRDGGASSVWGFTLARPRREPGTPTPDAVQQTPGTQTGY